MTRPHTPRVETVNDVDGFLVNFLRSVASDPDAVAYYADWPVSECDLTARHAYLVERMPWLTDRLMGDPSFCVPKMAGWWVWGACAWIGTGWCSGRGPWVSRDGMLVLREGRPPTPAPRHLRLRRLLTAWEDRDRSFDLAQTGLCREGGPVSRGSANGTNEARDTGQGRTP